MSRIRTTLAICSALALLAAGVAALAKDDSDSEEVEARPGRVGSAGQVVHIDPETGRRVRRPRLADPAFEAARRARLNRSVVGLAQRAGPRGGVMVDLRGRFRSTLVAEVDAEGGLATDCDVGPVPRETARGRSGGEGD